MPKAPVSFDQVLDFFSQPVSHLKGVGPGYAQKLHRLGLKTFKDLLCHMPRGDYNYKDVTQVTEPGPYTLFVRGPGKDVLRKFPRSIVVYTTEKQPITLHYFRKTYIPSFAKGVWVQGDVQGSMTQGWNMHHPAWSPNRPPTEGLTYSTGEGLTSARIYGWVGQILDRMPHVETPWTPTTWPSWQQAWKDLHSVSTVKRAQAQTRLALDEVLGHTYIMRPQAPALYKSVTVVPWKTLSPWPLTPSQNQACHEILTHCRGLYPMRRFLHGEVGSGKTIVAWIILWSLVRNGGQGVFLAPTEVLAYQHYTTLKTYAKDWDISVILLTRHTVKHYKNMPLKAQIIVGTHALLQEARQYTNLALIIIDEQHRFGVRQRECLHQRYAQSHHLLMSATPIPRTLAAMLGGSLPVSYIHPRTSQKPVTTFVMSQNKMEKILWAMHNALHQGHQVFWVCPRVTDQPYAVKERKSMLETHFPRKVVGVWGSMKGPEKAVALEEFTQGARPILVATTVIEVGIDVPQADLMIIEEAPHFGLVQLHQLRGRVGRGKRPGQCILLYSPPLSQTAAQRLRTMKNVSCGYTLAQYDLKARGQGNAWGTAQTGWSTSRFFHPEQHHRLVKPYREYTVSLDQGKFLAEIFSLHSNQE